jgi:hypothetical protein
LKKRLNEVKATKRYWCNKQKVGSFINGGENFYKKVVPRFGYLCGFCIFDEIFEKYDGE